MYYSTIFSLFFQFITRYRVSTKPSEPSARTTTVSISPSGGSSCLYTQIMGKDSHRGIFKTGCWLPSRGSTIQARTSLKFDAVRHNEPSHTVRVRRVVPWFAVQMRKVRPPLWLPLQKLFVIDSMTVLVSQKTYDWAHFYTNRGGTLGWT